MHIPNNIKQLILALALSVASSGVMAAALGNVLVLSNRGEPLNAEIDLVPDDGEDVATLQASLLPGADYASQNLEPPADLLSYTLEVGKNPAGLPVLLLHSATPVSQPALDLLLKLNGGEPRKISVVLPDMPAESETETVLNEPVTEAATEAAPMAETTSVAAEAQAPAPVFADGAYAVEKGDTLHRIALQHGVADISLEQMMLGLYRANPRAFIGGNMNRLKSGEILRAPNLEALKAITQAEAARQIHVAVRNWEAYRNKVAANVNQSVPSVEKPQPSSAVEGKIDTVQDQSAAPGPHDVVKLSSGDKPALEDGAPSKTALQEDLVSQEKALKEADERITSLQKQLQDANRAIQLRQSVPPPPVPAQPLAANATTMASLQEILTRHAEIPAAGIVLALLAAVVLLARRRKQAVTEAAPAVATAAPAWAGATMASAAPEEEGTPVFVTDAPELEPQSELPSDKLTADAPAHEAGDAGALPSTPASGDAAAVPLAQPADSAVSWAGKVEAPDLPPPESDFAEPALDYDAVFPLENAQQQATTPALAAAQLAADGADTGEAQVVETAARPADSEPDDKEAASAEQVTAAQTPVKAEKIAEAVIPELKAETEKTAADDHSGALAAAFDPAATEDLSGLDFGFDLDLGQQDKPSDTAAPAVPALDLSNINLNIGGGAASTAKTGEVEPVLVDTKLDLVTAYIDMNDEDGARELLQEILKEGGPRQIAKAQAILDKLGSV